MAAGELEAQRPKRVVWPPRRSARPPWRYRVLEHTADVGIVARGSTLEETFANAAEGMFSLITELRSVRDAQRRAISVSAPDVEALLVRFLNEANYVYETQHFLFRRFEVGGPVAESKLVATGYGEPFDPARHHVKVVVKAATYHDLEVRRKGELWRARVILDV